MSRATMLAFVALTAVGGPAPALAYAPTCASAESNFAAARTALQNAIAGYEACVTRADGHDDCAAAFRKLRAVQSDFATAVADVKGNCPPE